MARHESRKHILVTCEHLEICKHIEASKIIEIKTDQGEEIAEEIISKCF